MFKIVKTREELSTEDFIALVKKTTAEAKTEFYPEQDEVLVKNKTTPKARRLNAAIQGNFGCQEEAVRKLVEIIADEKLPGMVKGTKELPNDAAKPFAAFVPLRNNNSHDYPIGGTCLFLKTGRSAALTPDGRRGNNMGGFYRYATDEEIDDFFALPAIKEFIAEFELEE